MSQKPALSVKYDPDRHIVHSILKGNIKNTDVVNLAKESIATGRKNNCPYFLTDFKETRLLESLIEIYNLSSQLETINILRTDKIAIIIAADLDKFAFAEDVQHNRGFPNLKYFSSIDEAERWIFSKQDLDRGE